MDPQATNQQLLEAIQLLLHWLETNVAYENLRGVQGSSEFRFFNQDEGQVGWEVTVLGISRRGGPFRTREDAKRDAEEQLGEWAMELFPPASQVWG